MQAGCIGQHLQEGGLQAVADPGLRARAPCAPGGGLEAVERGCSPQRGAQLLQQGPDHLYSSPEPARVRQQSQMVWGSSGFETSKTA